MWIVKVALQRPYTFLMLAALIVFLGVFGILRTPTDIFPNIKIPIAAVIWRYNGLLPDEIADRIVLYSERTAQTTVNDVEHTESQSVNSTAVVKYFFQPDVNQDLSLAQIIAISQTQLQTSPPGTTPPFVLSYNASSVPILQLALSSETIPEQEIFDFGQNVLRTQLATVAGASIPYPLGGKQRQVQVDLDPRELRARGLAPTDVVSAIAAQNLILPAGTEKIGTKEYFVRLNASPTAIEKLNDLPIRAGNGAVLYVRDVAHVRDGYTPQTSVARVDGKRAVIMNVLKTGNASTLDIIDGINKRLGPLRGTMPKGLKLVSLSDQSVFVRGAISGVIRESIIAAALTGLMILLFLGSWRSTLIITLSIPLSILASLACLSALAASAQSKIGPAQHATYDNKYEVYGGINFMNGQAGQNLPKRMNLAGAEGMGTYWLTDHLGVAADYRFQGGTTPVFANPIYNRVAVFENIGLVGVQYRGPKGRYAAIDYHALVGVASGKFDSATSQYHGVAPPLTPTQIGLYTNRTKPMGAFGASVDFNYTRNIAIRLQPDLILEHFGTEYREFVAVSGGVVYRFGKR